jgi:methylmalonyl-CoA mutase
MSTREAGFAETSKQDWARAAQKELGGEDPFQKLSFTAGKFSVMPYYDATDLPTPMPPGDIKSGKLWINAPKVTVANAAEANRHALEHLQAGADGIFFELTGHGFSVEDLMKEIKLPFCSVFFYGNVSVEFVKDFANHVNRHGEAKQVQGGVYGMSLHQIKSVGDLLAGFELFTLVGHVLEPHVGDPEALSGWLMALTDQMSALDPQPQLRDAAVLVQMSDDLFAEVIRLRAIELLWSCLCDAYNNRNAKLLLHAWSKAASANSSEPHSNMISSVSRAVGAILGGAHAISIESQEPDSFQSRIARNISFILHEESQLARVANPVEGSYFIESASTMLAEEAWRKFQETVSR